MPTGRDRRQPPPAVVGVLLGTLLVLAGCVWSVAAPGGGYGGTGTVVAPGGGYGGTGTVAASGGGYGGWGTVAASGDAGTAFAAADAGGGSVPGSGRGLPDADDGARPGMPPRGSATHEPLPATQQLPVCPAGGLPAWDDVRPAHAVLRAPPLGPPSPVALSVLRV